MVVRLRKAVAFLRRPAEPETLEATRAALLYARQAGGRQFAMSRRLFSMQARSRIGLLSRFFIANQLAVNRPRGKAVPRSERRIRMTETESRSEVHEKATELQKQQTPPCDHHQPLPYPRAGQARRGRAARCKTGRPKKKTGFWESVRRSLVNIGRILANKETKTGSRTAFLLAEFMSCVFNTIAFLGAILLILLLYAVICILDWNGNVSQTIVQAVFCSVLFLAMAVLSLIFRAIANEIRAEKDRNYITTLFFGLVAFVSLIVSCIALFKEAG